MSDQVITSRPKDKIAMHSNVQPVADCKSSETLCGNTVKRVTEVPMLSCASVWLRCQKEAEEWIAPGGKLIADPVQRNRRINMAYAQLWLADHRFQWAGLAAFASKQVGCGLLHANGNVQRSETEIEITKQRPHMSPGDTSADLALPSIVSLSSSFMYQQLALGNTTLFLDIYPLHRFFMLRGASALAACLSARRSIINCHIIWPVNDQKLRFGRPFREITDAFEAINKGQIAQSVLALARHEQLNILQPAIYDDKTMQLSLDANQFSWVLGFPSGIAAEIQLTLSAACKPDSGNSTIWFPKKRQAKLYDPAQRMEFVNKAAASFDALLHGAVRPQIEESLKQIATGSLP